MRIAYVCFIVFMKVGGSFQIGLFIFHVKILTSSAHAGSLPV